ncbi:hypothetical protein [Aeoliella sp.]|uniref:hypothetical protein n=1 Tax=Aeoliella sp. TaxID=2795800 RepID=UPI003CCBDB9C
MATSWQRRLQTGPWLKRTGIRTWFYLLVFENAVWILYAMSTRTHSDNSILFLCAFWAVLPLQLLLEFRSLVWLTLAITLLNWPIQSRLFPLFFSSPDALWTARSVLVAIQIGVVVSLLGELFRVSDKLDGR